MNAIDLSRASLAYAKRKTMELVKEGARTPSEVRELTKLLAAIIDNGIEANGLNDAKKAAELGFLEVNQVE